MQVITVLFIALLVSFLWGTQPVIHKYLLRNVNLVTILFFQTAINFICISALAFYNHDQIYHEIMDQLTFQKWYWIFFLSVVTIFGTNILYFYILKSNESSLVSALMYSAPVFTMILAYFLLNERIGLSGYFGIFLIIIGVSFIASSMGDKEEFILK
jgi:drug/metabolite transporter (DMT)-like permease